MRKLWWQNKLEVHHIEPFHLHPEKELDDKNLITLCEGNKNINCHLIQGHSGNFKKYNPTVSHDADIMLKKLTK